MSVHLIYYEGAKKKMRPIQSREEYMKLRHSTRQQKIMKAVHEGDEELKRKLVQMNYSCLPNDDSSLKGSTRMSTTIGMDVDHIPTGEMEATKQRILEKKDELGLLMLEVSARGEGYHLVFRRREELTQEENLKWASDLLGVKYDEGAKDITRVFYTTTGEELVFLEDEIFQAQASPQPSAKGKGEGTASPDPSKGKGEENAKASPQTSDLSPQPSALSPQTSKKFKGIPYSEIIKEYWMRMGGEPEEGERNDKLHRLAANLRAICDNSESLLLEIMPRYGLAEDEMKAIIHSACKEPTKGSKIMTSILEERGERREEREMLEDDEDPDTNESPLFLEGVRGRLPQGISESIAAVGPQLAMPVVTAVCPCIGMLATGVSLDVHGVQRGLNLISYIAGDFASGKGMIDPVIDAWMSEVMALDKMYQTQEDEWRAKKRAAKNKKEQPEEPKLPVRCLTLNNTVANLAERLANTEGKHAFSFTPEADTVAQKWKSTLSDFSVMLRQSYDGTKYEREARSADAVNVHIEKLLWNVVMCGTPDALYRVVSNYTDGFQSRIAVARTPDNTFAPLEDKPHVLTERQTERIKQVAHLLPLMYGPIVLPKLEARGRQWLENVRLETMKNDDKVMARQRFRICVTAQRMTCCLMLCKVCEQLIKKHGLNGAETQLKQNPNLWKELLLKAQTPSLLDTYDVIADSLMENALHFFRERIENAFTSREYASYNGSERIKRGKNDNIFERLDSQFSFEQAMQQSVALKGAGITHNSVRQMLKNWIKQGLIVKIEEKKFMKKNG